VVDKREREIILYTLYEDMMTNTATTTTAVAKLPVITVPTYELICPSNGKKIRYRPFTVKEKKLFLLARESKDVKEIVETIKQVIQNCVVKPEGIDVDSMAMIDIELLFVHLRARSVGEEIELEFECANNIPVEGSSGEPPATKPCGGITKLKFNLLSSIEIEKEEGHTNRIEFTDSIGVVMKYPDYAMSQILYKENIDAVEMQNAMLDCVDCIYTADEMILVKDVPKKDLIEWFDSISVDNFEKMSQFFQNAPKIVGKSQFVCPKCQYTEQIKLQGIEDFFG
jgi:hypothetical protein